MYLWRLYFCTDLRRSDVEFTGKLWRFEGFSLPFDRELRGAGRRRRGPILPRIDGRVRVRVRVQARGRKRRGLPVLPDKLKEREKEKNTHKASDTGGSRRGIGKKSPDMCRAFALRQACFSA